MKTKIIKTLVLEYDEDLFCDIWLYSQFINKHLEAGDKIPARLLKKFVSFFENRDTRLWAQTSNITDEIKSKVELQFYKDPKFQFSKKLLNRQSITWDGEQPSKEDVNLKRLVDYLFSGITPDILDKIKLSKENCFNYFYSKSNYFFDEYYAPKKKFFSLYNRAILAGFITYSFGFLIAKSLKDYKDENIPNPIMFAASRSLWEKAKKKKDTR